ncbi:MAG: hypothetical protein JSS32_05850 [Verrucomicrobia bacterium]|nr:hypothetical protein [Verrucomicrobiota bacterium]
MSRVPDINPFVLPQLLIPEQVEAIEREEPSASMGAQPFLSASARDYLRSLARNTMIFASCYLSFQFGRTLNEPGAYWAAKAVTLAAANGGVVWLGAQFPNVGKTFWGAVDTMVAFTFASTNAFSFAVGYFR